MQGMSANTVRIIGQCAAGVSEEDIQSTAIIHSKTLLCLIAFLLCPSPGVNVDALTEMLLVMDSVLFVRLGMY